MSAQNVRERFMSRATKAISSPRKLKAVWDRKKKELGLTQTSAAEMLGYKHQSTINNYLNGKLKLSYGVAIAFAKILQVPLSEIWEGDAGEVFDALTVDEIVDLIATLPASVQTELALKILNKHHSSE